MTTTRPAHPTTPISPWAMFALLALLAAALGCGEAVSPEPPSFGGYACCRDGKYYDCVDQMTANWCDTNVLVPARCDRQPQNDGEVCGG